MGLTLRNLHCCSEMGMNSAYQHKTKYFRWCIIEPWLCGWRNHGIVYLKYQATNWKCVVCVCRNIQCTILSSDLTFLLQVKVWLKWLKISLFKDRGRNFKYNSEVWLRRRPVRVEDDVRVHLKHLKHLKHLLVALKAWAPFVGVWWHQCSKTGSLTLEFVVLVLQSRVHTNFSIRWSKTAKKHSYRQEYFHFL